MEVTINTDNEMIDEDIKLFRDCLSKEDERIAERLRGRAEGAWVLSGKGSRLAATKRRCLALGS